MTNKHMKIYLTSFSAGKCKSKPHWNNSYSPGWLESKSEIITSVENVEKSGPSSIADGTIKCHNHFEKVWQFPNLIKIKLSFDSVISFPVLYPRQMKTCPLKKKCTWMVIAELFIIAKMEISQISVNWVEK